MSAGFYKVDGGDLLYAPNAVYGPTFTLLADSRDDHQYPVDGWAWFDSEDAAREALGVPLPTPE